MISRSSIVEKKNTFLSEMIHIMFGCVMHLYDHSNKMVPLMKPSIFADFSNGIRFHVCTRWSTNDTCSHRLCVESITTTLATKTWSSRIIWRLFHNEILDIRVYHCSFHTTCPLFRARAYMTFLMVSCVAIH
jgi:hypothetical protein